MVSLRRWSDPWQVIRFFCQDWCCKHEHAGCAGDATYDCRHSARKVWKTPHVEKFQIGFWVEASLKFHMNGQPERGLTSEFQQPFFEEEGLNIFSVLASLLVDDQLTPGYLLYMGDYKQSPVYQGF